MVDIQSATTEIRRGKNRKEEKRRRRRKKKPQNENIMSASIVVTETVSVCISTDDHKPE